MGMPGTENSVYLQILKENPKKSNLNSLWAFLVSVLVYVWVFYVFNLSPSADLLCTTKFWFIISNTLILIIAADFSSSSSSSKHHHQHPSLIHHHKTMPIAYPSPTQEQQQVDQPPEKIINVDQNKPPHISKIHNRHPHIIINKSKYKKFEKTVGAGDLEKEGKMVSEKQPVISEENENEFTKMSNEELNKRVEEFIRRCNTQIRLQARG